MSAYQLVFGYGAIMHREDMRELAPNASLLDIGRLRDWRIGVTSSGWLGITPEPEGVVHGALFQLGPDDESRLDAFEAIDRGLYTKRILPVDTSKGTSQALVYVPTEHLDGVVRNDYLQRCVEAGRELGLPTSWLETLQLLHS
ncbi:MAG: gamma-glutamylcyclotransferase [Phycisphaerales bacterium]|nr:gamma-glutamylcyclotransferase [Phycisphaerales bacterium]